MEQPYNKGGIFQMKKIKVTNTGRRIRERLGSRFLPNQEQELIVNNRQYLTLKAVKDFNVEIIEDEDKENNLEGDSAHTVVFDEYNENSDIDNGNDSNINNTVVTKEDDSEQDIAEDVQYDEELDYYDLNIEEVLKAVKEGAFDVDEAIAYEVAGKNRVTLLEKLEEIKKQDE